MKNLIVLFGTKQSGKTTSATAVYGMHLVNKGILPNVNFDANGRMSVVYDKGTNNGIEFDIDTLDSYVKATYPDLRNCLYLSQQNSQTG
jgi:hypothetical protein